MSVYIQALLDKRKEASNKVYLIYNYCPQLFNGWKPCLNKTLPMYKALTRINAHIHFVTVYKITQPNLHSPAPPPLEEKSYKTKLKNKCKTNDIYNLVNTNMGLVITGAVQPDKQSNRECVFRATRWGWDWRPGTGTGQRSGPC